MEDLGQGVVGANINLGSYFSFVYRINYSLTVSVWIASFNHISFRSLVRSTWHEGAIAQFMND